MRLAIAILTFIAATSFGAEPGPAPREIRVDSYGERLPDGVIARLGTTRFRHYGADVLTFDPTGKKFITSSRYDGVRVWDAATGMLLDRWNLPPDRFEWLCLSADGRTAVIHGKEHLEIWDLPSGKIKTRLPLGDAPSVSAACLSADGLWLASADFTPREHRLRLWDLQTGKNRVVGTHEGRVEHLILSSDGSRLFSLSTNDGWLKAWDLDKTKLLWSYWPFARRIALSNDNRRLLVNEIEQSGAGHVTVLDASTGKKIVEPIAINHSEVPTCLSRDGSLLACQNDGTRVGIYDVVGQKELHVWHINAQALAFSPDAKALYVVESSGALQAYSVASGKPLLELAVKECHTGAIRKLSWSPDGKLIATAGANSDPAVRIWDSTNGKLVHRLSNLHAPGAGLEFSRDGRSLWTCGHRSPLFQWDVATGKAVKKWFVVHDDDYEKPYGQILSAKMLADGIHVRMFLVGNEERERPFVATFNLESGKFEGEKEVVMPFHLLDQTHLLDNRMAGAGQVFNPANGEEFTPLGDPDDEDQWINTRLSSNTWLIAGARWKQTSDRRSTMVCDAVVFERTSGRELFALPRGPAGKYDLSPDGQHLAVAAPDGIHIWDLAERKEVRFLKAHDRFYPHSLDSFATAIAWSPDGKRLATGHFDTTVLIWDAAIPQPPRAQRLTKEELAVLWADLANPDPKRGLSAAWTLRDRPEQACELLSEHLRPVAEPADIKLLIAQLDDSSFRQRDAAQRRIAEYGDAAAPALRAALKAKPSEEQRKRIGQLLAELDSRKPPRGDDLRGIRCLMVLASLNTPESKKRIAGLAEGIDSARLTKEARYCLARQP